MKVTNGNYLNGMPANESYNIELSKGVTLTLSQDEYQELASQINEKASKDLQKVNEVSEKYWARQKNINEFIKEVRDVFYEDLDDIFLKRSEINEEELSKVLDKYGSLLGFE